MRTWKIGELARRTGLTVRTLHHYDAIGLLAPSVRSPAGYRLYDEADVRRLQRVISLKQLGLSLEEVRECLARPEYSLEQTLRLQLERLRARIEEERALCRRLEAIASRLEDRNGRRADDVEAVSAEELLGTIEATIMFDRHYTPEQQRKLDARRQALGEEAIRAAEQEWPQLIGKVKECMARGVDPAGEEMRPLALRWKELVGQFTGGDPGIAGSVKEMYRKEPEVQERTGLDMAVFDYVGRAVAANGGWS